MRISLNNDAASASGAAASAPAPAPARWGKRAGVFLFLFFLIKGLAWIAIPAGAALIAFF